MLNTTEIPTALALEIPDATRLSVEQIARAFDVPVDLIRDPQLDADGRTLHVDTRCPACGWPERGFDTLTRRFRCVRCPYQSDERNG